MTQPTDGTPTRKPKPSPTAAPAATVEPPATEIEAPPVSHEELDRLVGGAHHNPHGILGTHPSAGRTIVRTLRPDASTAPGRARNGFVMSASINFGQSP